MEYLYKEWKLGKKLFEIAEEHDISEGLLVDWIAAYLQQKDLKNKGLSSECQLTEETL